MDWQSIMQTVITGVVSLVVTTAPIWIPMLIAWLKEKKIIRTKAQEELAEKMIPQVVDAVEAWEKKKVKAGESKPTGNEKMAKAQEIAAKRAPVLKDADDLMHRIEAELFKRNGS